MNEFLQQFLVESRELALQATHDLLALEQQPADAARIDGAFRAFHTLKGAAGIIEFEPMARALHAAEELLSRARSGAEPVTPDLISRALTALDQVEQWLEEIERTGEVPTDAEPAAAAVIGLFEAPAPGAPAETADWSQALAGRVPAGTRTLIRWIPPQDGFFQGLDPLAEVQQLPGLLALEIAPRHAWPALAELNPYACQLVLLAASAAQADDCRRAVQAWPGEVELVPHGASDAGMRGLVRDLLDAQLALLDDPAGEVTPGRLGSAAAVGENLLRSLGRAPDAERFHHLAGRLIADLDAQGLREAMAGLLETPAGGEAPQRAPGTVEAGQGARALRVEVERIDELVNLTGELTVAKNALGHLAAQAELGLDPAALAEQLRAQHAGLDRLVQALQAAVLNVRVLPLRQVFQRFPRLVREMAAQLDRPVRLQTEGDDTEADKAIVESLFEPLLHLLRNALDHGVEPAGERAAAGKAATATIRLSARREGEHVVVEVADDGRGIDVERVRRLGVARGLLSAEAAEALTDQAVLELIFAPGFSTAAEVTRLSGRGVGMDAVRTAIERLGGRVAIESRAGEGARVRLILPFTVMMSRILTVEAAGQLFGIPLEAVSETLRVPRDRIVGVGGARAIVHRDRTLPVIRLGEALGGDASEPPQTAALVIASAAGHAAALEVDRIGERMDLMLKPLDGLMAAAPGLAGATLLGDGQVLLVLDLQELLL